MRSHLSAQSVKIVYMGVAWLQFGYIINLAFLALRSVDDITLWHPPSSVDQTMRLAAGVDYRQQKMCEEQQRRRRMGTGSSAHHSPAPFSWNSPIPLLSLFPSPPPPPPRLASPPRSLALSSVCHVVVLKGRQSSREHSQDGLRAAGFEALQSPFQGGCDGGSVSEGGKKGRICRCLCAMSRLVSCWARSRLEPCLYAAHVGLEWALQLLCSDALRSDSADSAL